MIHGPFNRFEAMMLDAFRRAPYVADAFKAVTADLAFDLLDQGRSTDQTDVINRMAVQCGMVIGVRPGDVSGRTWTYELTED